MPKKKYYLTTTLPYINSKPHLGHLLEFVQGDYLTRLARLKKYDAFFNIGTDEHGSKVYDKACTLNMPPQEYCDMLVAQYLILKEKFNLSYDNFIRTTDEHHIKAAQEFWARCYNNGDIYKKNYKVKYCKGCELEKTDSELVNERCHLHFDQEIEIREEENYFFRFSKYQKPLLDFYKKNPEFVVPKYRFNEIFKFVENGLQDFSISRVKSKMPWGINVPNDDSQVMYVWFDALINYISAISWPSDLENFFKFWPCIQIAGKDNIRQQAAMWQAMLMSAGIENSSQIFIHGFINADNGQKMSKSLGNTVDPIELVEKYGVDATRYYLLREINSMEDSTFSYEKFEKRYNFDLANDLGNLLSRTIGMIKKYFNYNLDVNNYIEKTEKNKNLDANLKEAFNKTFDEYFKYSENYFFAKSLQSIWDFISTTNKYIDQNEPWFLAREEDHEQRLAYVLKMLLESLYKIAILIRPAMPDASDKMLTQLNLKVDFEKLELNSLISWENINEIHSVNESQILFPRLE